MDEAAIHGGKWAHLAWRRDHPATRGIRSARRGRIIELDGIRGIAAVAIIVVHARPDWLPIGWAAVDLFFCLSGFLITSILLEHGDSPRFLGRFYMRRGLRIWPIYYFVILGFVLFRRHLPVPCDWRGLWYYLTYTQNVPKHWSGVSPRFHGFLGHTWSLAIEEQFYILWPALVLAVGARRVPTLAFGCLGISVASRAMGWSTDLLLTRMDGLALGAWLAALLQGESRTNNKQIARCLRIVAVASVAGLTVMSATIGIGTPSRSISGAVLLAVNVAGTAMIGVAVTGSGSRWLAPLRWKLLTYLGQISYGLYLYHYVILMMSAGRIGRWAPWEMSPLRMGVTLSLCLIVSVLSWTFIERPILRLKDRFEYAGRGAAHQPESRPTPSPTASQA